MEDIKLKVILGSLTFRCSDTHRLTHLSPNRPGFWLCASAQCTEWGWWAVRQASLHALLKSVCFGLFPSSLPPVVFIRLQVSSWYAPIVLSPLPVKPDFFSSPSYSQFWLLIGGSYAAVFAFFECIFSGNPFSFKSKDCFGLCCGLNVREWTVLYSTYALEEGSYGVILQHAALQWALPSFLAAG